MNIVEKLRESEADESADFLKSLDNIREAAQHHWKQYQKYEQYLKIFGCSLAEIPYGKDLCSPEKRRRGESYDPDNR